MSGVTWMCYQFLIRSMSLWPAVEKTQSNRDMLSFLALLLHCLCCSFQTNFLLSSKMTYILADSSIWFFKRRLGSVGVADSQKIFHPTLWKIQRFFFFYCWKQSTELSHLQDDHIPSKHFMIVFVRFKFTLDVIFIPFSELGLSLLPG